MNPNTLGGTGLNGVLYCNTFDSNDDATTAIYYHQ